VARRAGSGKALELANGRALVAILAQHRRVRAQQGKAVLVIIDLLYGDLPALHGVTLRAVRPHFSLVNIGVTILAILADICKHGLGVALYALHFLVHATQRIFRFVVVEFRDCANGSPARGGVAILAWHGEGTVRTSSSLPLSGGRRSPS